MSRSYIPKALREQVTTDARRRCGYFDHIVPESLGGPTTRENLWLACSMCNDHKGSRIAAADPLTGTVVRLFDPRRQHWTEHFEWSAEGDVILGKTARGRATVTALRLNRAELVEARRGWIIVGWHPPKT